MEQHSRSEVPSTKGELLANNSPKEVPSVAQPKAPPTLHKELSHLLSILGEQLEANSQASLLSVCMYLGFRADLPSSWRSYWRYCKSGWWAFGSRWYNWKAVHNRRGYWRNRSEKHGRVKTCMTIHWRRTAITGSFIVLPV